MDFKLDDNIMWILLILLVVFLLPRNDISYARAPIGKPFMPNPVCNPFAPRTYVNPCAPKPVEEPKQCNYIYWRKKDCKERRRLVY